MLQIPFRDSQDFPLIRHLYKAAFRRYNKCNGIVPLDEFLDMGMEAYVRCLERYDEKKGSFKTYSDKRVTGAMLDASQGYINWRHLGTGSGLGRRHYNWSSSKQKPHARFISPPPYKEEPDFLLRKLCQSAPEDIKNLLGLTLDGWTQTEIAIEKGLTGSAISQQMKKAYQWLRENIK